MSKKKEQTDLFNDVVCKGETTFHKNRDAKGKKLNKKWHDEIMPDPSGEVILNIKIGDPTA